MQSSAPKRTCGAILTADGSARWRVWAPACKQVELVLFDSSGGRELESMTAEANGYFSLTRNDIAEAQPYCFRLDGDLERPDPCSLYQPEGVAGASAVFAPDRFEWTDSNWVGLPRAGLSIYELHVGTFTPAGTFDAIIPRLAELQELGVSAIEIMPVAQFPGDRNWGYDGVFLFAAQNTYGGPRALQRLVNAAHAHGIAVILDVVYNHFGPEANHIRDFGPYFTEKYKTPWGDAVNYDDRGSDQVRAMVLDNVRMWIEEFHMDGLRLDAVHAIYDLSATHILREIRRVAGEVAQRCGREIHIIGESDLNDPRIIDDTAQGGHGLDAQWSDDFHHSVHSFLTGERSGYYMDYGNAAQLEKVINTPFVLDGQFSVHRGRRHGAVPVGHPGDRFVVAIQNHDQVGNRALGDRLSLLLKDDPFGQAKLRLAACLMLLSPYVPMLFMGEEYGETAPFPFFCSFADEALTESVRQGRRREFADFVTDAQQIPDPTLESTFESAKLTWHWARGSSNMQLRQLYQQLLLARRSCPPLLDFTHRRAKLIREGDADHESVLELTRGSDQSEGRCLRLFFNLSGARQPLPLTKQSHALLFSSAFDRYGGERPSKTAEVHSLLPYECVVFGSTTWRGAFASREGKAL